MLLAPVYSFPSKMSPAPKPVPKVRNTMLWQPRPRPEAPLRQGAGVGRRSAGGRARRRPGRSPRAAGISSQPGRLGGERDQAPGAVQWPAAADADGGKLHIPGLVEQLPQGGGHGLPGRGVAPLGGWGNFRLARGVTTPSSALASSTRQFGAANVQSRDIGPSSVLLFCDKGLPPDGGVWWGYRKIIALSCQNCKRFFPIF